MAEFDDDIEKYCRGELSPEEMHALERRALSDPFLADALEGASSISAQDFSGDLKMLRSKLHSPDKKVITLWTWVYRIAASIALVGVVTYLVVTSGNQPEDKIALNKNDVKPPTTEQAPAVEQDTVAGNPVPGVSNDTKRPGIESASESEKASNQRKDKDQKLDERLALSEDAQNESAPLVVPPTELLEEHEPAAGAVAENALPTVQRQKAEAAKPTDDVIMDRMESSVAAQPKRIITGVVVDAEEGNGLPGVNVMIKGTDIGTVTDEEGRYKIPIDSLKQGLQFSFIGYEEKEVLAEGPGNIDVQLSPDVAQLSEVVVVGYGGTKREDLETDPIIELAAPSGGRRAYKKYLTENLKYPEQALNNKVEGRVTIQFTVEATGRMTNFKVLKGLGNGCDEEVMRLIRQGPKWRPSRKNTEPVTDKVKVRLRFTLPKKP